MDEKILNQLRLLKKYVEILKEIKEIEESVYLKDAIVQGAAERYLQLSIESCINIGNRILCLEQIRHDVGAIETYVDIFKNLSQIEIIDSSYANSLINMVRVHNRLVHFYWDLDNKYIYKIIQNNIADFDEFCKITAKYINDKNENKKYLFI